MRQAQRHGDAVACARGAASSLPPRSAGGAIHQPSLPHPPCIPAWHGSTNLEGVLGTVRLQVATEFGLRSMDVLDRIQSLDSMGRLTGAGRSTAHRRRRWMLTPLVLQIIHHRAELTPCPPPSACPAGVMDERGKFIYISSEEMQAVADYIRRKGRVAIAELAARSNDMIDLNPRAAASAGVGRPTAAASQQHPLPLARLPGRPLRSGVWMARLTAGPALARLQVPAARLDWHQPLTLTACWSQRWQPSGHSASAAS